MATLVILTAEELKALNPLDRQAARRAARQEPLARLILRTFLERGGSIPVEDIIATSPGAEPGTIHDALVALDDEVRCNAAGGGAGRRRHDGLVRQTR